MREKLNLFEIVQDENGKRSATRVILVITLVIFGIAAITDIFYDSVISERIYDIIKTIFGFGLGGQALRTTVKNYRGNNDKEI